MKCIARFVATALMIMIMGMGFVHAAVPNSINYQGFLADDAGVPIDATHNITFRIYSAASGGSALYTSTQLVTVSAGRFNTKLGDTPNFPANLFDSTPLFLGLEIDSDGEMTPRQPLSSTPYAYKAEDADTVGGVTAASLNQSAHVSDTDNPHEVNATQVGAASLSDLSDHAISESVHHFRYSNSEAVTAMGAIGNNNALNHNRYTNSSAVSAMGSKSNINALNHDRYTDLNAVSAVLAADGADSTLDADLLDGMQASQIIAEASDEVRTAISSLPFIIDTSGSYYFTQNLSASFSSIEINADNVTLDLMGFTLSADGTSSFPSGIIVSGSFSTIRNGTIKGFPQNGISSSSNTPNNIVVEDIRVIDNGDANISNTDSGIYLQGTNHKLVRVTATNNAAMGVNLTGTGNFLKEVFASNNGASGIRVGDESRVTDSSASYSSASSSPGIRAGNSSKVENSSSSNNASDGIEVGQRSSVYNCKVSNNSGHGIEAGFDSLVLQNTALNNDLDGIRVDVSTKVLKNHSSGNQRSGVFAAGGNLISGNTINENNQSQENFLPALRVEANSLVENNLLFGNIDTAVLVGSTKNVLRNNHIADVVTNSGNSRCLLFASSDNAAMNNTASGCTIIFGTTQPPASRFIGNIGW